MVSTSAMSATAEDEVTSLKVDLDCTVQVKNVQHRIKEKEQFYIYVCPSVLSLKLGFGTCKDVWLSLFFSTKPCQTYLFSRINVMAYHDDEGEEIAQLATRSSQNTIIGDRDGMMGGGLGERGWNEFISLQSLTDIDEFRIVLKTRKESHKSSRRCVLRPASSSKHAGFAPRLR